MAAYDPNWRYNAAMQNIQSAQAAGVNTVGGAAGVGVNQAPPAYDILRQNVNLKELSAAEQQMLAAGDASVIRGWSGGQATFGLVSGNQPGALQLTSEMLGSYADQYWSRLGKSDAQLGVTPLTDAQRAEYQQQQARLAAGQKYYTLGTARPVTPEEQAAAENWWTQNVGPQVAGTGPVPSDGTKLAAPTSVTGTKLGEGQPTTTAGAATVATDGSSTVDSYIQNMQDRLSGAAPGVVGANNPLIAQVVQTQQQSRQQQESLVRRYAPAGREGILEAAPELRAFSDALMRQATDPLGGGFGADVAERIRVQQAAAGLSGGRQAAFQEAALVARAGEQRRLGAAQSLQALGGTFLQQLGIGQPLVADLAGIGQFQLASQAMAATQAAGQAQAQTAQNIYQQVASFLQQREVNRNQMLNLGMGYGPYGYGPITGVTVGQGDAL